MSFIQNMKMPTPTTKPFQQDDYVGGLNNVDSPLEIASNESTDMLNVIFNNGSVETRPGAFKYLIESKIPYKVLATYMFNLSDGRHIIFFSTEKHLYKIHVNQYGIVTTAVTEVFYGDENTPTTPMPYSLGFQFGTRVRGGVPCDAFYFTNSKGYFVYLYQAFAVEPENPDMCIMYKITTHAVDEYHTSNGNTWFTSSGTAYYMPTEAELADEFYGENICTSIFLGSMELHKGMFFFSNSDLLSNPLNVDSSNIIYYSAIDNPFYIPTNHFIPIDADGERIYHIESFNGALVIMKDSTVTAIYGNDYTDWNKKTVNVYSGTIHPQSVVQVGNYLRYLGTDNILYDLYDVRTDYEKMLVKNVSESLDFFKAPISLTPNDLAQNVYKSSSGVEIYVDDDTVMSGFNHNVRAIYANGYYILSINNKVLAKKDGQGWILWDDLNITSINEFNDDIIFTDSSRYLLRLSLKESLINEVFTQAQLASHTTYMTVTLKYGYINNINDITCYVVQGTSGTKVAIIPIAKISNTQFTIPTIDYVNVATGDSGRLHVDYKSMKCYNDNGRGYNSFWQSKDYDMGYPQRKKQLRKMYCIASTYQYFNAAMNLYALIDYYEHAYAGTNFDTAISIFGISKFGSRFIDKNVVKSDPINVNKRGSIVAFRVEGSGIADEPFKLMNISGDVEIKER